MSTSTLAAASTQRAPIHGHIAARIHRLPLTAVQWRLAILATVTLGLHHLRYRRHRRPAVPVRLAPVQHHHRRSVCGHPGLAGRARHPARRLPDELGRRPLWPARGDPAGDLFGGNSCIWLFAYVTNFWVMVFLSVLSTLGAGGIITTQAVYLSEMTSSAIRNKVLLASQGVTALVADLSDLLAVWLIRTIAGLPVGRRGVLDPCSVAAAELAAAGVAAYGSKHMGITRKPSELSPSSKSVAAAPAASRCPEPDQDMHPVVAAKKGAWQEIFRDPQYRDRTIVALTCWLLGNAGMIYGSGAFAAVYMVDHGATAHFVFLTFVGSVVVFFAFQVNARISEGIERRDVMCAMACSFAATFVVVYLAPNLWIIAGFFVLSRIGVSLWLFNLYNYTAVAYPTRIRATAFAWTDGLGIWAPGGVNLARPHSMHGPEPSGLVSVAADPRLADPGDRDPFVRRQAVSGSPRARIDRNRGKLLTCFFGSFSSSGWGRNGGHAPSVPRERPAPAKPGAPRLRARSAAAGSIARERPRRRLAGALPAAPCRKGIATPEHAPLSGLRKSWLVRYRRRLPAPIISSPDYRTVWSPAASAPSRKYRA